MPLLPEGFVPDPVTVIVEDLNANQRAIIDPSLDVDPDQPLGQINGIVAARFAYLEELISYAFGATDPDKAEGIFLDSACALTGVTRREATRTVVECTLFLSPGTYPANALTANILGRPDLLFRNRDELVQLTPGVASATFVALNAGSIPCTAGSLTVRTVAVSGWASIVNAADGVIGSDAETDAQLRVRRRLDLAASGSGTAAAIRADVLRLPGILEAFCYENTTEFVNIDGMPPKSFETVIYDGFPATVSNLDVAKVILNSKPAGIQSFGQLQPALADGAGNVHVIGFTRAVSVPIFMDFTVVTGPGWDPVSGPIAIQQAVLDLAETEFRIGKKVRATAFKNVPLQIAGVEDVSVLYLGLTPAPSGTGNVAIGSRQIARVTGNLIGVTAI